MNFLFLAMLNGVTVALSHHHCSYQDAAVVMREWNQVTGKSAPAKLQLATVIAIGYLKVDPASKVLFQRVNVEDVHSGEFQAFIMRVTTTLSELINKLHSPEVLDSMLEHLANQHAATRGVTLKHFKAYQDALANTLSQLLDEYNPDAWKNCLQVIIEGIASTLP